jgi:3D (Asp-Asp-Asp) domain-containing protein
MAKIGVVVMLIINVLIAFLLIDVVRTNQQLGTNLSIMSKELSQSLVSYMLIRDARLFDNFKTLYTDINSFKTSVGNELEFALNEIILNRKAIGSIKATLDISDVHNLIVTAYTPDEVETDKDPEITAAMIKVRPGIIAVSRDLFEDGWTFGKKVYIEGMGIYTIGDLMNKKWEKRIDILLFDKKDAHHFGKRQLTVALLTI